MLVQFKRSFFSGLLFVLLSGSLLYAQDVKPVVYAEEPISTFEQKVLSKIDEVAAGRLTDQFTGELINDLPLGIIKEYNGTRYIICIDSAYKAPDGSSFFNVYAALDMPGASGERKRIAFAGKNIAFNKNGISSSSNSRISLASLQSFNISENVKLILPADGQNYIEFDCSGFKSVNLKGSFVFDPDVIVPDPELSPGQTAVTASLQINAKDLNNILIATSITPFQVSSARGISFAVKNATVDMSDITNPQNLILAGDYSKIYGPDIKLWRGFYLEELDVYLPSELNSKAGRTSFKATNLLIDDRGVTGKFTASNLITLENGSAGGWPFSINKFSVQLTHSQITGGGFGGAINIPFLGADTVGYAADLWQDNNQMNYQFLITFNKEKEFNIPFAGLVHLDKTSAIGFKKVNGKLSGSAVLQGNLELNHKFISVKNIKFQNLELSTAKPYLIQGQFTLTGDGQARSANFPIQIDSINLGIFQGKFSIGIPISLNIMNSGDKTPSAGTYVRILASNEEVQDGDGTRQRWKLEKVSLEAIKLNIHIGAVTVNGLIQVFQDDPVYGNGFHGRVMVKVGEVLGNGVSANAYFGSKDDYRYWHFDIYFPVKIPVVGPLYLDGIMGGVSYKMIRKGAGYTPDFTKVNSGKPMASNEITNMEFYPDAGSGMTLMAGVTFVAGNEKAVNGDVLLEIAFNPGGGLKYVQFSGAAYVMSSLSGRQRGTDPDKGSPLFATVKMLYDNDNKVFHANLSMYINYKGVIEGTAGPGGLAGEAVIHIDKHDWYVYIGKPSRMFGVSILNAVSAKSYFMIGTQIEDLPLPPSEVAEMFYKIDVNFMRDENMASSGRGFATGFHFEAGFDSQNSLFPFFIMMKIGAGADVMIRDYGQTTCKGGNGKLGIDGWYASGQAYVFLKGAVGLRVGKKSFDILRLGAAALLQAKLPNPSYFQGGLAGEYSVLGGLVHGRFNLAFTLGTQCQIVNQGNELGDIKTISDIKPDDTGTDVSVFTAPQVSFNLPVEKDLPLINNDDQAGTYRIKMDELKLFQNNSELAGNITWNENKDVATIKTKDILPEKKDMKVTVKIHWEKKTGSGSWEALKDASGQIDYESKEAGFKTGDEPKDINGNISYSYPLVHQYHFYPKEHNKGYVKLGWGQPKVFSLTDSTTQYNILARLKSKSGQVIEVPIVYDDAATQVNFDIPTNLNPETVYTFDFIKVPQPKADGSNISRTEKTISSGNAGNEVKYTENALTSSTTQDLEKNIYSSDFRTSRFATFSDKWDTFSGNDLFLPSTTNQAIIGKGGVMQEIFDAYELNGVDTLRPLVRPVAGMQTPWLQELMYPLLYENYAQDQSAGLGIKWRKTSESGIVPLMNPAVKLYNDGRSEGFVLNDTDLKNGFATTQSGGLTLYYFLSYFVFNDYQELLNQAAAKALNGNNSEGVRRLLDPATFFKSKGYKAGSFIDLLPNERYPVMINYTLPGTGKVTSTKEVKIKF